MATGKLEHRQITVGEAMEIIFSLKREDLREYDLIEFDDYNGVLPDVNDIFGYMLCSHIGINTLGVRIRLSSIDGKPCFMATRLSGGHLCGFGWRWAEQELRPRQKYEIAADHQKHLIDAFGALPAQCYVHAKNKEVLSYWIKESRQNPGVVLKNSGKNPSYWSVEVNKA